MIGALVLACIWEMLAPSRKASPAGPWRWLNNLALAGLDYAVALALLPVVYATLVLSLGWQQYGMLPRWNLHPVAAFGVLFFALEAINYLMHRLYHAVPLL